MSTFTECFTRCAAEVHWALGVLAFLALSSVAVGLTKYTVPVSAIGKALAVLDRISFLVHRDSPGTLKVPGLRSSPPEPTPEPPAPPPPASHPVPAP